MKDYEEDFEETDESAKDSGDEREQQQTDEGDEMEEPKMQRRKEIEAIQKAMNEENQRVGTTQTVRDDDDGQKLSTGLFPSTPAPLNKTCIALKVSPTGCDFFAA